MRIIIIILLFLLPTTVFSQNGKCENFNTHDFYANFDENLFIECIEFNNGSLIWEKDSDGSIPLFKLLNSGSDTLSHTIIDYFFKNIDSSLWQNLQKVTDIRGRNAMMISVENSPNWKTTLRLIYYGGEVDLIMPDSEESLLSFAVRKDDNENIVALLVAHGAEISDAIYSDKISDMQAILKKEDWGKDVNNLRYSTYRSPVFDCNGEKLVEHLQHIFPGLIDYCVISDADFIDYIDRDGNTLLHLVAQYGSNPTVIDAIMNHIDKDSIHKIVNSTNSYGKTALELASVHSKEPSMVSRLIAWGSDPNITKKSWNFKSLKKHIKQHLYIQQQKEMTGMKEL